MPVAVLLLCCQNYIITQNVSSCFFVTVLYAVYTHNTYYMITDII